MDDSDLFPVDLDDLPAKLDIGAMQDGSDQRIGPYRVGRSRSSTPAGARVSIEADGRSLVYATARGPVQ